MTPPLNFALQGTNPLRTVYRTHARHFAGRTHVLYGQTDQRDLLIVRVQKPVELATRCGKSFLVTFGIDPNCRWVSRFVEVCRNYAHHAQPLFLPPASKAVYQRLRDRMSHVQGNRCTAHASLHSWLRTPLIGGYA